jgi:hypothetical protein
MIQEFEVGDKVRVLANSLVGEVISIYRADKHWYTLDNNIPYKADELELIQSNSAKIEIFYKVEGLEFNNLVEAQKHSKKIRLWKFIESNVKSDETQSEFLSLVDSMVDNATQIVEILK